MQAHKQTNQLGRQETDNSYNKRKEKERKRGKEKSEIHGGERGFLREGGRRGKRRKRRKKKDHNKLSPGHGTGQNTRMVTEKKVHRPVHQWEGSIGGKSGPPHRHNSAELLQKCIHGMETVKLRADSPGTLTGLYARFSQDSDYPETLLGIGIYLVLLPASLASLPSGSLPSCRPFPRCRLSITTTPSLNFHSLVLVLLISPVLPLSVWSSRWAALCDAVLSLVAPPGAPTPIS